MTDNDDIKAALPDYLVERELGQGGMGIVFLGRHARLGRLVAIKELPPSFAADPDVRERFSTEARTLASLSHPHIVPIYDYVERDGLCLIVMEELPGGTVWDRFTSTGLTPPTACAVVIACCAALQHAHDKGVLHLDVKPDNLMFARDTAIKVTDFGISRVLSGDHTLGTVDGQVLGTPAYMSPEQARGSELTQKSDVYSAGVMLYELLSGHLPWTGAESATDLLLKRLREDPRPLREIAPQIPQALADVVMKAIQREPENRYDSAEDFGVAVAGACADSWGTGWLDIAGVTIVGSERLSIAARTTRSQPAVVPERTTGPTANPIAGTARETVAGGAVEPGSPDRVAPETTAVSSADVGALAGAAVAAGAAPGAAAAPAPPVSPPEFQVVRAAGSAPRIEGANLNQIERSAFVDVAEAIGQPHGPALLYALAVALVVAAVVVAGVMFAPPKSTGTIKAGVVTIGGRDVTRGIVKIDPTSNLPVRVNGGLAAFADQAELKLTAAGIPVGQISTKLEKGQGTFKTNVFQYLATGSLTGRVDLSAAGKPLRYREFPARLSPPWYKTVLGIGGLLAILAGFAYLEGSLRAFRRGRRRISAYIGAGLSSAVIAVGVIAIVTASGHANPTVGGIIVAVLLSAGAGIALGAGIRRSALRKGAKRAVRRAESAFATR